MCSLDRRPRCAQAGPAPLQVPDRDARNRGDAKPGPRPRITRRLGGRRNPERDLFEPLPQRREIHGENARRASIVLLLRCRPGFTTRRESGEFGPKALAMKAAPTTLIGDMAHFVEKDLSEFRVVLNPRVDIDDAVALDGFPLTAGQPLASDAIRRQAAVPKLLVQSPEQSAEWPPSPRHRSIPSGAEDLNDDETSEVRRAR